MTFLCSNFNFLCADKQTEALFMAMLPFLYVVFLLFEDDLAVGD